MKTRIIFSCGENLYTLTKGDFTFIINPQNRSMNIKSYNSEPQQPEYVVSAGSHSTSSCPVRFGARRLYKYIYKMRSYLMKNKRLSDKLFKKIITALRLSKKICDQKSFLRLQQVVEIDQPRKQLFPVFVVGEPLLNSKILWGPSPVKICIFGHVH